MDGDIEDGDFGRGGLGRDDVDLVREVSVEVTVEDVFFNFIRRFERMSSMKEIREILVYFYMMMS